METGLGFPKARQLDGYDKGESIGLSLAFQEAQVDYRLAQQFACLWPCTKLQQMVECFP